MVNMTEVATISFTASFIFALGGVGAAVAIIPILVFLGVPFSIARPAGLFTNFISVASASVHNIKNHLVDFKLAVPLVVASMIVPPFGAYLSHLISERIVGVCFALFLLFAGIMVYVPKKSGENFKEYVSPVLTASIGGLAGFLSGFLGVGGGGVMSPLLILSGLNPKKVAATTAFAVPFSSFVAFLTYWKMGSVNWALTLYAAVPSAFAGYLAAYIAHRYLRPGDIKKLLGIVFFILAAKMFMKFI